MFHRKSGSDALALLAARAISANVMVADENFNIVYMNDSVTALLRGAEADLRKDLPQFSVSTLIGTNIDVFHKDPELSATDARRPEIDAPRDYHDRKLDLRSRGHPSEECRRKPRRHRRRMGRCVRAPAEPQLCRAVGRRRAGPGRDRVQAGRHH